MITLGFEPSSAIMAPCICQTRRCAAFGIKASADATDVDVLMC